VAGETQFHSLAAHLPALAMSRPAQAREEAEAVLAARASTLDRTYAWHALGIMERDAGQVGKAISNFRRAAALSAHAGLVDRHADVLASLGTALAMAGRRSAAMRAFDEALEQTSGRTTARVLVRRAAALVFFDEFEAAYADGSRAAALARRADDRAWEARARSNLAGALLGMARFTEADAQYRRAQELAESLGQRYDATIMLHSRADCARRQGDLPRALRMLRQAHDQYRELGVIPPEVVRDTEVVLLAAGLTDEATTTADELVELLDRDRASAGRRADGLIAAATAHLDHGNTARAIELASRAAQASHRQGSSQGEWHARLVLLRAQAIDGRITKRHARVAANLAAEIQDRYAAERLEAHLLAGRLARRTGLTELAVEEFTVASAQRHKGSALRRAAAWLAAAQLADMRGDRTGMLRACERGLAVLDTHALSLGATELRAQATTHGMELVRTAIGRVLDDGSARDLLRWTERWRSILHAAPDRRARRDHALAAELAALREVEQDVSAPVDVDRDSKRRRIEERIRRLTHERAGDERGRRRSFDVEELLAALGADTTLAAVLAARDRLHVVVARRGRVRRFEAGVLSDARTDVEYARFALRAAGAGSQAAAEALLAGLDPALARLEHTLLGPQALRAIGDGPLVLMPPATLQSAPWPALPSLRDRPVTVTPSATAWLRARATSPPRKRRVALIAGPGLNTSGAEVAALASTYRGPTVLTEADATCSSTLRALDGSWLAHVAAHGRFRGDNPMFSALEMADGPLTVYDFEGMRRPPYRLLLTACESGVGSPTGADELLGLASSLTALGTSGLLASVVPVNDEATVPFSLTVHKRLQVGDTLAAALLAARQQAEGRVALATAWSFLALGAV
jgi:CHAT domain-containing protein/tetratricopeptide (TPR) repeat protein